MPKKVGIARWIFTILVCILSVLAALIVRLVQWVFRTWAHLRADELLYHLRMPMQGTNRSVISDAIMFCVPAMVLCLAAVIVVFIFIRKKRFFWWIMLLICAADVIAAAAALNYGWNRLNLGAYLERSVKAPPQEAAEAENTEDEEDWGNPSRNLAIGRSDISFIDGNYISPADARLKFPETKRNLVYIYLESMETTYADRENGGAFNLNCIPELTELAQQYEDFSGSDRALNGGYDMPSTTWTVAAMFAQTSGLPLRIPFSANMMSTQDTFFPSAITLGDILEEAGYQQALLIGSEAVFGGRDLLFKEHGNYTLLDYTYAIDNGWIPDDYYEWWGFEDSYLFEFARRQLREMASKDEPFNLTMLTADTHFEDGYICDLCADDFDTQYANVMACSSRQVAEFVRWIMQQDFYENTTIIIVGDHHTMDSDFCYNVSDDYLRRTYTAVINAAAEVVDPGKWRNYTTFDMFPTILASLGVKIEGNRLGLGTNLFSDEETLLEIYGMETMEYGVEGYSELMESLMAEIDESRAYY